MFFIIYFAIKNLNFCEYVKYCPKPHLAYLSQGCFISRIISLISEFSFLTLENNMYV